MVSIKLSEIRRDGGTQSRASLDEVAISEYAEKMAAGVEFPAMVVFYDGEAYWMADGFHRAAAYERAGVEEVGCDVRQGTKRDAILHSVGANAQHGVRRSNADKRRAVETLLRDDEWRRWSDRKIAEACGVSDFLVRQVRESRSPTTEPETRIGADGVERSMPRRSDPADEPLLSDEDNDDLPPPVDVVCQDPEPEPASERRPITVPPPDPEPEDDGPSQPMQSVADAWNEMTPAEQNDFLDAVGAVRFATLEALAEQRMQDDQYKLFRKLSEPGSNAGSGARMIAAVLDGADWALARLGLTWSSTEAEAKRAFKQASLQAHPDRGGTDAEFTAISRANAIVMRWLQGKAA